ncbi:hypothetical protein [Streptomyces sp. NPDC085932]|uniref:hypothetical protein n=1 Tax=Streptomyces sp. NPDC085932 TaxID=3365741 RepID=UPI0037D42BD9
MGSNLLTRMFLSGALLASSAALTVSQAVPAAAANPPVLPPALAAAYGSTPAFADEFNDGDVNENDWYYRITGPYNNAYMHKDEVDESGNALHLAYNKRDVSGDGVPDYVSGGLISRHNFGYGYYETRAKLYAGTAPLHTSFWSMGLRKDMKGAGGDPRINEDIANGILPENNQIFEIDGFEHDTGPHPDVIDMGNYPQSVGTTKVRVGKQPAADLGINFADWNVYGYEYTPQSIKFYINGVQIGPTIDNVATKYQYNPMNLWLTALPYYPAAQSVSAGSSDFDYVRYWNKPLDGANLLGNGSFDAVPVNAADLWIVPGWIESYSPPASAIATDVVSNGTRSLIHKSSSAYTVTTKQNLTHIPNGTYKLKAKVQSSGGQTSVRMRVLNHGSSEVSVPVPTGSTWMDIEIPNISVTNNKATIAFTSNASANQWMRVDAVSFARTTP